MTADVLDISDLSVSDALEDDSAVPTPWDSVEPVIEFYPAPAPPKQARFADPIEQREAMAEQAWDDAAAESNSGGAFTIPLICLGIALIAACLLIPAADEVRALAYERDRLKADLAQLQKQVATNDAFLKRVADDPNLAERLARRQMKMVPEGTAVMDLKGLGSTTSAAASANDMSPFLLVTVPPPAVVPPYKPVGGGILARAVRKPKTQLYLIGGSLMMIAAGLVLSRSSGSSAEGDEDDVDDASEPTENIAPVDVFARS